MLWPCGPHRLRRGVAEYQRQVDVAVEAGDGAVRVGGHDDCARQVAEIGGVDDLAVTVSVFFDL